MLTQSQLNRVARVAGAILLTRQEAALVLGMSVNRFDQIRNQFQPVRTESGVRYRRKDLERYANSLRSGL